MDEENIIVEENVYSSLTIEQIVIRSDYLEREVIIDIYFPAEIRQFKKVSLLLVNDGQDLVTMNFAEILDTLVSAKKIEPLICLGIHCGYDRKMEYGTACQADYNGRGARAGLYTKFVFEELLPVIAKALKGASIKEKAFAGFSLGALSAFDIVWNHPVEFSKVGIFSGSLWWRRKGYDKGYDDFKDRIMHLQVRKGRYAPSLKFFFECGVLDESADRNNNGIIDSIDDTLDMIAALKAKGYSDSHIRYLELPEGKHDVATWGKAFPEFLKWGWGVK